MKKDGTLWIVLGDCYAGSWGNYHPHSPPGKHGQRLKKTVRWNRPAYASQQFLPPTALVARRSSLKPKDLVGVPWRIAFALQADGWWLRNDIVWNKPNSLPESVRDRCTRSHEYIFHLAKSRRYYYDAAAISEPISEASWCRMSQLGLMKQRGGFKQESYEERLPGQKSRNQRPVKIIQDMAERWKAQNVRNSRTRNRELGLPDDGSFTRNARTVWTITTQPYRGAHFAVFPQELARRCILAGSRSGGVVLDPFLGSGTTAEVALKLGRKFIGIDLNEKYVEMSRERISKMVAQSTMLEAI